MKKLYRNKYRVETTRLKNWDYSWNGIYFLTICTYDRQYYFGDVVDGMMKLTDIGKIAHQYWYEIPQHYPMVKIGEFVIMPNHVHGIIILERNETNIQGRNKFGPQSKNIPAIIRGYKSGVKKYATMNEIDFKWQSRYYDRIIRSQKELDNARRYIFNNPAKWEKDKNNGSNLYI